MILFSIILSIGLLSFASSNIDSRIQQSEDITTLNSTIQFKKGENNKVSNGSKKRFDYRDDAEELQTISFALDTNKLYNMAVAESKLYADLKTIYNSATESLPEGIKKETLVEIQSYLEGYEESVHKILQSSVNDDISENEENAKSNLWSVVTNPITMFQMIQRLLQFSHLEQDLKQNADGFEAFKRFRLIAVNLMREQDLRDAYFGILRLQFVHELSAYQISQGIFGAIKTNAELSTFDVLDIGLFALSVKRYALAIDWLETAKNLARRNNKNDKEIQNTIKDKLKNAKLQHDQSWRELEKLPLVKKNNLFFKQVLNSKPSERVTVASLIRQNYSRGRSLTLPDIVTMDLCAGHNFQSEEIKSKLNCWLETKRNPYWRINPLKMELLNKNPDLVQIYDFIGDGLINKIITESTQNLTRSGVISHSESSRVFTYIRTSINTWLDDDISFLESLNKKIEFLTSLKVQGENASQSLQVVDYSALGSHYDMHVDALLYDELIQDHGERVATFMLYLNNVEMGGFTSFPLLNVATYPIKGSAVLWYNLHNDLSVDYRTYHAGCPVVLGRKLVANKWILQFENMFNRKCGLKEVANKQEDV